MYKLSFTIFLLLVSFRINCQVRLTHQYKAVKSQLDTIIRDDQVYRSMLDSTEQKYGFDSKEIKALWSKINLQDSLNLVKVKKIVNKYGWLGENEIGKAGNEALFLVIQHSDKSTMEEYLPVIKLAVQQGRASGRHYAMLRDRVEMLNHRPQIYGTQVQGVNGTYRLYPITDEKNVNKRRKEIGLNSIEDYVKLWNIDYKAPAE